MIKRILLIVLAMVAQLQTLNAQNTFAYRIELSSLPINNLPGLHSYAFGTWQGKWLIVGGRKDGIHARQPFNAFPASFNNTSLYVIDPQLQQFWSAPLTSLSAAVAEQLQSSNMNFYQHGDTLLLIGGYAYSVSANDHKTFEGLITIVVSSTIQAIINTQPIAGFIKQINGPSFAVTGGQLGRLGNEFILVGGHRFDGRYNPMGNPTYTQSYTNQIRKFQLNNSGSLPVVTWGNPITDAIHLHRRDYNLLPQVFPNRTFGYTISSGVFQTSVNLPYLYPVDIGPSGISPVTSFSQYLSNYHSAKAFVYDSLNNQIHSLFFGGMSQYAISNGQLVQDNNVPFVKTISRLTRNGQGQLQEFQHTEEMPGLKGSSAEFIPNPALPYFAYDVVHLNPITADTILLGHIFGGILSPTANPFTNNATGTTQADPNLYKVFLIKTTNQGFLPIKPAPEFSFSVFPNPINLEITLEFKLEKPASIRYFFSNLNGSILEEKELGMMAAGDQKHQLPLHADWAGKTLILTLVNDHKYCHTEKVVVKGL